MAGGAKEAQKAVGVNGKGGGRGGRVAAIGRLKVRPTPPGLNERRGSAGLTPVKEIIFEVREAEAEGGYIAQALGDGIHTQADTLGELREMVKDAVGCHFEEADRPRVIRLHFVRDEVLAS